MFWMFAFEPVSIKKLHIQDQEKISFRRAHLWQGFFFFYLNRDVQIATDFEQFENFMWILPNRHTYGIITIPFMWIAFTWLNWHFIWLILGFHTGSWLKSIWSILDSLHCSFTADMCVSKTFIFCLQILREFNVELSKI